MDGSAPNTPPHQHPTSLTRIKSAASMVPGTCSEGSPSPQARVSALTHETRLNFQNFVLLFQAFRYELGVMGIFFPTFYCLSNNSIRSNESSPLQMKVESNLFSMVMVAQIW